KPQENRPQFAVFRSLLRGGAVRRLVELLVGQLASDDFLECNISKRHAWRRFNHGPMSQAKLANAFGNDVDQKLLIRDHLSCFLQKLSRHMAQGRDGADCFRRELKNNRQTAGESGWGKLRGEHGKNECGLSKLRSSLSSPNAFTIYRLASGTAMLVTDTAAQNSGPF